MEAFDGICFFLEMAFWGLNVGMLRCIKFQQGHFILPDAEMSEGRKTICKYSIGIG